MKKRGILISILLLAMMILSVAAPAAVQADGFSSHPYLTITPSSYTLSQDETRAFVAIWHVSGQPDKNVTNSCQWSIDNTSNAILTGQGIVKGKADGQTKLRAYYAQGNTNVVSAKYAAADLTISTIVSLQVNPGNNNNNQQQEQLASSALLTKLKLSAGPLTPTFSKNTTTYTCSTSSASTTVTPTAEFSMDNISVNAVPVGSGLVSQAINLDVGSNTIKVVVTSHTDPSVKKTYTVTVKRSATLTTITTPTLSSTTPSMTSTNTNSTGDTNENSTGDTNTNNSADDTINNPTDGETNSDDTSNPGSEPLTMRYYIGSTTCSVNGSDHPMDAAPIIVGGRTLLPIRFVAGPLHANMDWKAEEKKVTVVLNGKNIELWIGEQNAKVNGDSLPIDPNNSEVVPIVVPPGRTMLPLRFIAEELGCKVEWDRDQQMVTVIYPKT